jgi:hypothetical protein
MLLALPACRRSVIDTDAPTTTSRYAADGLAFSYPDTMWLERGRKDVPLRVVFVRSDRAFAMIGWTPRPVDADKLRERAYLFARERVLEHASIDTTRSGAAVTRSIGGHQTDGVVVYGKSGTVTLVGEVYALQVADASVMLLLFYPEAATRSDLAMLHVVASTLGPDERSPD